MTYEAIKIAQSCDVKECNARRIIHSDDRKSEGWQVRHDKCAGDIDVCPDHVHLLTVAIIDECCQL